jgi:ATP phosphoribosyltransferase
MANERLQFALPKGVLQETAFDVIEAAGIDVDRPGESSRRCVVSANNYPVDFWLLRASEVPERVQDEAAKIDAGITGSDILWEYGRDLGPESGEEIPVNKLATTPMRSRLYVGVRRPFMDQIDRLGMRALEGRQVGTKFTRITRDYFEGKRIKVGLRETAGADEAMPGIYDDTPAVLGVISSGISARENSIVPVDIFHTVSLRLIASEQMSGTAARLIADFRGRITDAVARRRTLGAGQMV